MRVGFIVMMVVLLVIAGRLVMVQGLDTGNMAQAAETQRTVVQKLPAARGKIIDAKGKVLAESIIRYNITVSQVNMADYKTYKHRTVDPKTGKSVITEFTKDEGLQQLADLLGLNFEDVKKNATGKKTFNYIVQDVSPVVEKKVAELGIPGIYSEGITKRVYPMGAVGGPIVGFVDAEGTPLAGVEQTMNDKLTGTDGARPTRPAKTASSSPRPPYGPNPPLTARRSS